MFAYRVRMEGAANNSKAKIRWSGSVGMLQVVQLPMLLGMALPVSEALLLLIGIIMFRQRFCS